MATRKRTQLRGADGEILGEIEPPPSVIREFVQQWINWLYNLYTYTGIVNEYFFTVEDWNYPTLSGAWVNLTGLTTAYYIDPYGIVRVRLQCKSGTGTIFTLPVGYRPSETLYFVVPADSAHGEVSINASTGVVSLSTGTAVIGIGTEITFRI